MAASLNIFRRSVHTSNWLIEPVGNIRVQVLNNPLRFSHFLHEHQGPAPVGLSAFDNLSVLPKYARYPVGIYIGQAVNKQSVYWLATLFIVFVWINKITRPL